MEKSFAKITIITHVVIGGRVGPVAIERCEKGDFEAHELIEAL
jgi:hypothetical protein